MHLHSLPFVLICCALHIQLSRGATIYPTAGSSQQSSTSSAPSSSGWSNSSSIASTSSSTRSSSSSSSSSLSSTSSQTSEIASSNSLTSSSAGSTSLAPSSNTNSPPTSNTPSTVPSTSHATDGSSVSNGLSTPGSTSSISSPPTIGSIPPPSSAFGSISSNTTGSLSGNTSTSQATSATSQPVVGSISSASTEGSASTNSRPNSPSVGTQTPFSGNRSSSAISSGSDIPISTTKAYPSSGNSYVVSPSQSGTGNVGASSSNSSSLLDSSKTRILNSGYTPLPTIGPVNTAPTILTANATGLLSKTSLGGSGSAVHGSGTGASNSGFNSLVSSGYFATASNAGGSNASIGNPSSRLVNKPSGYSPQPSGYSASGVPAGSLGFVSSVGSVGSLGSMGSKGNKTSGFASLTGVSGSRPAYQPGASGIRPPSLSGASGGRPALQTGASGSKPAFQSGVSGGRPAFVTGASGLRPGMSRNSTGASGHAKSTGTVPASITAKPRLPRPVGTLSNTPVYGLNATLPPELDRGWMSLSYGGLCQMGQSCVGCTNYNAQSCSCANSVSKWFNENKRTTVTTRVCSSSFYGSIEESTQPQTCSIITTTSVIDKPFRAEKQCCDKCNIRADEVQVIFWPDTGKAKIAQRGNDSAVTASPVMNGTHHGSGTVIQDGNTFVSPSVYVSYKGLGAHTSCVSTLNDASAWTDMGRKYTTIRSYDPNILRTAKCFAPVADGLQIGFRQGFSKITGAFSGWEPIKYQNFLTPPPIQELVTRYQKCFPDMTTRLIDDIASVMYASPRLSMPPDVTDINPLWKTWGGGTCTPVAFGAMDPPKILHSQSDMVPGGGDPAPADEPQAQHGQTSMVPPPPTPAAGGNGPTTVPALPAVAPASPTPTPTAGGSVPAPQGNNPAPQGNNPAPQGNNPAPQGNGNNPAPQGNNPAPQGNNPAPQGNNPAPQGNDPAPQGNNPAPQGNNPAPQGNGNNPVPQGNNPAPQGNNPAPQGNNPAPQGNNPTPQENKPAPQGNNPAPQGNSPQGNNPVPQGNGNNPAPQGNNPAPQGNNPAPQGNNAAPQWNNPAPQGNGNNPAPQGNNPAPQGNSPQGNNPAPQGNVLPQGNNPAPQGNENNPATQGNNPQGNNPVPQENNPAQGNNPQANNPAPQGNNNPAPEGNSPSPVNTPMLAIWPTPLVDPVTTLSPNDPAFVKNPQGNPGNPQANPQPSPNRPAQPGGAPNNVQQVPPVVNPNSVPLTLTPINPSGAPQNAPNAPQDQVGDFIAQGFNGGPPPPVVVPNSGGNNGGNSGGNSGNPPAQGFQIGGPGAGNVATNVGPGSNGGANVPAGNGAVQTNPPFPNSNPFFNDNQVVQSTNGGLQVGGQKIVPGAQTTISGHTVNYPNPSSVVVDGNTYNVNPISNSNPLVVDNQSVQRGSSGALVIAGSTISPGAPASISGHVYSLAGPSNFVVDSSTYALPPSQNAYLIQAQPTPTPTRGFAANTPVTLGNGVVVTPQNSPSQASNSNSGAGQAFAFPNGQIISNGGSPVIVSGTTYSALPSNQGFVVNGVSTVALPTPPPSQQQAFSLGSQIITPAPSGFVIGGASISPGAPATTISGTPISLDASSHLYVGSSVMTLGAAAASPFAFVVGGQTITAAPSGFPIASTSLTPGGPGVTISGTVVSLDSSSHLQIGSSTITLNPTAAAAQSPITIGSQIITPAPSGFTLGSTSVSPGGPAITVSGTVLSLDSSSHLILGSSTITLAPTPSPPSPLFTVGAQSFTANPSGFAIAGTTLTPGGPAQTISGTRVSLDASSHLTIGSSVATLPPPSQSQSNSNVFTAGSYTFTAEPNGFTIGTTTLSPGGPPQTVSGTLISLDASSHLTVGSNVATLTPPSSPQQQAQSKSNVFTAGSYTFTAEPNGFNIGSLTLAPGGSATTVSGTLISLDKDGKLVLGSSTFGLAMPTGVGAGKTTSAASATSSGLTGSAPPLGGGIVPSATGATPSAEAVNAASKGKRMEWFVMIGILGILVAL